MDTRPMKTLSAAALGAALMFAAFGAAAQGLSYRCVGADGKKYYGSSLPPQCVGQPVEQLNAQGMVVKRVGPAASAAEREAKAADEVERKKREVVSKEEGRRNRALLATYTSESDIESSRKRALKDNEIAVKDIERRIDAMKKKQAGLQKEFDTASKANAKPPAKLGDDLRNADFDIKTQEGLL
ncbi:MAG: hypothetical protein ACRET8_00645, partial [Burkholderiales bacterium]